MSMNNLGLHHMILVTSDTQRTVDFYTQKLGLPLVKQAINIDAPSTWDS
jgi:catechol 2,3-dioxygenase-like lactoylglutathione lyase family enzyme